MNGMSVRRCSLVTTEPEAFAARLGSSWSERATLSEADGQLTLRWKTGEAMTMRPSPGLLSIELYVPPGEDLEDLTDVVSRALHRMESDQPLQLVWV